MVGETPWNIYFQMVSETRVLKDFWFRNKYHISSDCQTDIGERCV